MINRIPFKKTSGSTGNMIVTDAGTVIDRGTYIPNGTLNGKIFYEKDGGTANEVMRWNLSQWQMGVEFAIPHYYSSEDVATPDLVVTWTVGPFGTAPAPTVVAE